jgi:LPS-assembly lipoprotein
MMQNQTSRAALIAIKVLRPIALACVMCMALGLAACGFQLQGRAALPKNITAVYVDARDEQSDFVHSIRKSLVASGVQLAAQRQGAPQVIEVLEDIVEERVLSVSARNVPREYELTHRVRFNVRSGDNLLVENEEIRAVRDVTFDETQLLAREREQEILRDALAQDLAALLMRRLAAL